MLAFLFLTPSFLHLSLAHVGAFWHDAPCVCIRVCLKVSAHSLRLYALVLRICFISTPLHKIRPFWEAFHPSTPIFSLACNTKHHHSHANLLWRAANYTNATGGPPLFLKQSFEMNAHGENFPYSLERRKQVQMKIHAQKQDKSKKESMSSHQPSTKKNTLRPVN